MTVTLLLFLCSICLILISCAPISKEDGMNFLINSGYTNNKTMESMTEIEIKEAIEKYQNTTNIPMTGVLDETTKEMMEVPRCNAPDNVKVLVYTGRWNNSHLTYKFWNYPTEIANKTIAIDVVTKAMQLWIDQVDLVIEEITDDDTEPDINIQFVDISAFESELGLVLAYAAPPDDGDMYYVDENFTNYYADPVDLYQIAVHEFGHSLGLYHFDDPNSVMYPKFIYKENITLHSSDIQYIEKLYGKKYSLCQDGNIDAAFAISSNTIYILRGFQVWKYILGNLQTGYPKLLSKEFPGLKSKVDATFVHNDHIYFIQGTAVLKFNGTYVEHFDTFDQEYDTAVNIDDRLYTFKGMQYWRYDINEQGMSIVRTDYPRNISRLWKGVPGNIDAVYFFDGDIYFFKGTRYYKFDIHAVEYTDAVDNPISEWIGCKNNN